MNNRKIEIAPSILSADFRCLERQVKMAEEAGADRIHCDIMDGHFVPNISFGPMVVETVRKCVSIPLDVHLMISDPDAYVRAFCDAGAATLIVHAEACTDIPLTIDKIRSCGVRPGITVNPDKPVELFLDHLPLVDQVLIMTVYAGFGGQKFIPGTMAKVKQVHDESVMRGLDLDIEVDGGVNDQTAVSCAANGANVFVAGNYVFTSNDFRGRIGALRDAARRGCESLA